MKTSNFHELPVFCDDTSWIWLFIENSLKSNNAKYIKLSSAQSVRQIWERVKSSDRIIVHWDGKHRIGGAIIEEILEINPGYDIGNNIIVVTANPVREDVVYLSELGVKRLIRLRHKDVEMQKVMIEMREHLENSYSQDRFELAWQRVQRTVDTFSSATPANRLDSLVSAIEKLHQAQGNKPSARYLDALASIAALKGDPLVAEKRWVESIELNPNFFRAYNKLATFYVQSRNFSKALETLQRIANLNRYRISRNVDFGNVYLQMQEHQKAEHYFKNALDKDSYSSGALNGLAEIRFYQGELEEARTLLERTTLAYRFAARLNTEGIKLVQQNKFEAALEHYTRAQFVLPQREKGPRLFFNIGLCYYKWNKPECARDFLKVALVKEPNYKKAANLLARIDKPATRKAA